MESLSSAPYSCLASNVMVTSLLENPYATPVNTVKHSSVLCLDCVYILVLGALQDSSSYASQVVVLQSPRPLDIADNLCYHSSSKFLNLDEEQNTTHGIRCDVSFSQNTSWSNYRHLKIAALFLYSQNPILSLPLRSVSTWCLSILSRGSDLDCP